MTIELNESELIARAARRRGSRSKRAILQHNRKTLLRLRAAGISYREMADAFAEQGVSISAATIWRFLKETPETLPGDGESGPEETRSDRQPDWDSNGGSRQSDDPETASESDAETHRLAAGNRPEVAENIEAIEAMEAEEEEAFWQKIRKLKEEVAERQAGELPDTRSLRRHLDI